MMQEVRHPLLVDAVVSPELSVLINAELAYLPDDPFAVYMRFPADSTVSGEPGEWVFARALLRAGMSHYAGSGGVRIWPVTSARTAIALESDDGTALLEADTVDLSRFLDEAYAMVPVGCELGKLSLDLP